VSWVGFGGRGPRPASSNAAAVAGDDLIDFIDDELFPYLAGFGERGSGPDTIE